MFFYENILFMVKVAVFHVLVKSYCFLETAGRVCFVCFNFLGGSERGTIVSGSSVAVCINEMLQKEGGRMMLHLVKKKS
jgi:hypothetical protein